MFHVEYFVSDINPLRSGNGIITDHNIFVLDFKKVTKCRCTNKKHGTSEQLILKLK